MCSGKRILKGVGDFVRKMGDKHKMILGLAARYLVVSGGEMTAEKVYQNMTFKSGKFAHKSTQCSSLLT